MKNNRLTNFYIILAIGGFVLYGLFLILQHHAKNIDTFFVYKNIQIVSYTITTIVSIVSLIRYFNLFSILILVCFAVTMFGQLYFLDIRLYNTCIFIILIAAIVNLAISLVTRKHNPSKYYDVDKNLLNGVLPLAIVGIYCFFNSMEATERIFIKEEGNLLITLLLVASGLSIIALVLYIILQKDRFDKGAYFGKMATIFFTTLLLTLFLPYLSINQANYAFDDSTPTAHECVVLDKYRGASRYGGYYQITLDINGESVDFRVDRHVFVDCKEGSKLTIYQYDGAFDTPYYEIRYESVYIYNE